MFASALKIEFLIGNNFMNLQLQDCRICRGVIRIHRHGHELCCSAEQSDSLQWGMEGQLVDNAIWADTVTRSTLAELWSHRGHVATRPVPTRASNEGSQSLKVHNQGEAGDGPYLGLLLFESRYYCFHF